MIFTAIDKISFGPNNGTRFKIGTVSGIWTEGQCRSVAGNTQNFPIPSLIHNVPTTGGSGTGANVSVDCNANNCTITVTEGGKGYKANDVLSVDKARIGSRSDFTFALAASDIDMEMVALGVNIDADVQIELHLLTFRRQNHCAYDLAFFSLVRS